MGRYLIDLAKDLTGNRIYTVDGGLWLGYKASGISLNSFDSNQNVAGVQLAHITMLRNFARIPDVTEVMMLGVKTSEPYSNVQNKILMSIPEIQKLDKLTPDYHHHVLKIANNYPGIMAQLQEIKTDLESLSTMILNREYYLFFSIKNSLSMYDKVVSKIINTDVHYKLSEEYIASVDKKLVRAFHGHFNITPTTPKDIVTIAARRLTLGSPPPNTLSQKARQGIVSLDAFPNVDIDLSPESDLIVAEIIDELNSRVVKDKTVPNTIRRKINHYQNTHTILVRNLDMVSRDFPNGVRSYQNNFYLTSVSRTIKESSIHDMTFLCDQINSVDADWTIRLKFDSTLTSNKELDKRLNFLEVEQTDNSFTSFDAAKYDRDMSDIIDMWQECFNENESIGCRATVIFHLGAMNLDKLEIGVANFKQLLSSNGLESITHPGGCFEALKLGLPGSARHAMLDTASLASTIANVAASAPLRSNQLGDMVGFPLFYSRENALNQFVYWDILNTTKMDACGDLLIAGQMGSGKSYLMKNIFGALADFKVATFTIDSEGEYAVFAQCIPDSFIVFLNNGDKQKYTIDPLVVFADDPALGAQVWMDTVYPMLGIPDDDLVARSRAEHLVNPGFRRAHEGITGIEPLASTRDIWLHLRNQGNKNNVDGKIFHALNSLAVASYTAALFNPVDGLGNVKRLPAVDVTRNLATIFRFNNLTLPSTGRLESFERIPISGKYAVGVVNILDALLNKQFAKRPGPKAVFIDEMHKYSMTKIMSTVRFIAKEGRKNQLFGVYASPSPGDFDSDIFATSARRVGMSQASEAVALLEAKWCDAPIPEPAGRLIQGFSPRQKLEGQSTRVVPGRESEAVYNDGFDGFGVVQGKPQFLHVRHVYANTNAGTRLRETDIDGLE